MRPSGCLSVVYRWTGALLAAGWLGVAPVAAQAPAKPAATKPAPVVAGTPAQRYERGKQLLFGLKYPQAMNELQSLTIVNAPVTGPTTNAATYLWAVAALRAGRAQEADPVLRILRDRQPQWGGMPDVILLQAQVAEAMGDRGRARTLLQELPVDKLTAEKQALLARLGPAPGSTAGAPPSPTTPAQPLRVAALLPFNLDDAEAARRTQWAQELYAGLKLAADSLSAIGTPVEVLAFDLGNDTVAAKTLVQSGALDAMDLIVGPIYKAPSRLVARAVAGRMTPVVNPLSEDGTLTLEGPSLFLLRPSVQTQARAAAKLAYERFEPKTAVLVTEETRDDAAFAAAFRAEYERLGGQVKLEEKISSQTYRTRMTEKVGELPIDSASQTGVLVVASKERNAAQQVASRLERDDLHVPVIAPASWLELTELSLEQFSDKEFYFLAPTYRPILSAADRRLRRAWQQRYRVPPSDFGKAGFELLYVFGPAVRQFGAAGLADGLSQRGVQPGALLAGFGYTGGTRDNQAVSILKLTNRVVEVVK